MTAATVMLIDDEPINNIIHKRILLRVNPKLHILEFTDPSLALEYIIQAKEPVPDFIFLDIYMPEMYAWDFLDALPEKLPHSRIYVCTGSEDFRDTAKVNQYPAVRGYIHKPFDSSIVERILKN